MKETGVLSKVERETLRKRKGSIKKDNYRKRKSRQGEVFKQFPSAVRQTFYDITLVLNSGETPDSTRLKTVEMINQILLDEKLPIFIGNLNEEQKKKLVITALESFSLKNLPGFIQEIFKMGTEVDNGRRDVGEALADLCSGSQKLIECESDLTYKESKLLMKHLKIESYSELKQVGKTELKKAIEWLKTTNQYKMRKSIEKEISYIFTNNKIKKIFYIIYCSGKSGIDPINITKNTHFTENFVNKICNELVKREIITQEIADQKDYCRYTLTRYGKIIKNHSR